MAAEMEKEKSAILDVVSELVMLLDGDLKVIWSNAAVNREFNIEAARLEGRRCFEALHGLKRPCRVCPVVTAFRTNQPCVIDDFSSLGKRWRLRAYPLRDRDGHATSVVEIVTDITEQKLAEEALKRGEEKFRSLVETVGDWVWETDATGACTYASPRIRDLLGYEPEEVLGKRAFDFMASAERERVGRVFREAVRSRAPLKAFECTALHKSGREVVLETSGVPITDAEGNLLGYRGIDRDITARKRGEAVLHEGEKTYRSVIENIQDVFYRSDRAGRLLMASPSGARMFGYDRVDDMIGMSLDVFWPDAREREKILEQILATGGVKDFEAVLTRKDGSMFNAAFTTHFYYDDQGRFQGTEGIIRDITDRKRAEEALEKRILALTRPLDAVETIAFEDLFNPADLQQLQDLFADIWGVAALITRPDGTPVTRPSNFTYFCSDFIRRNEKGFRNCQISDATLGRHHPSGPIIRPCMSAGLWGAGASITIGGRHIASWLIGQVRNEAQSEEQIMQYAREIGADETGFREAYLKVPEMPREKFEKIAHALFALANQLSTVAYQNIQQARFIAELKAAEEALRESEMKFRGIYEASPIGIELYDREGTLLDSNRACHEIFGVNDPAALQGFKLFEDPNLSEDLRTRLKRGESVRYEIPFDFEKVKERMLYETSKSGIMYLDLLITPLREAEKASIVGYLVHVRDITERRRTEEALRESEARFRSVVESAPLAIGFVGRGTRVEYLNPKFVETFGYTLEDIPTMADWFRLAFPDPDYREITVQHWTNTWRGRVNESSAVRGIEVEVTSKDGSVRTVEVFRARMGNKTLAVLTDLTERRRMEEKQRKFEDQMREVQKLESLGVLAGGIAHDFNNLLMAILGNADLVRLYVSPAYPAHRNVEEIIRAAQRAADLCRQMLAYSGKGRFVVGRHDLSKIVQEMGQMLTVSVSKKAIVRYDLAENLPAVESDVTQIRQVIMNLITNASESLGESGGMISVTTGVMECDEAYLSESYLDDRLPAGSYVFLEVSDSGCGMDAETLSRMFDPFFTTKFTGRGLGLAAVLGIVRGHRGAIRVYSETGKGTTFRMLLPAAEGNRSEEVKTEEQDPPLQGGETILLVDDDLHVRAVAMEMLEMLGFKVLTAGNGREALEVFRARGDEIACVILDLTMPEMGGEEAFRELRRLRSDVRVILSSGYNEQDVTQRFVGRGLAGFIQKPYKVANLRSALNRALS